MLPRRRDESPSRGRRVPAGGFAGGLGPYALYALFALCFCLAPLARFALVPSSDLPQHLAISSVLWRLAHGDPHVAAHFAVNVQPIPYYGAYGPLTLLVGLVGPLAAARLYLSLVAAALVGSAALCLRAARAPAPHLLGIVFVFFGPLFYYGFLATLAGLVWLVLLLWAAFCHLDDRRAVWRAVGSACGVAAVLAHAFFALPVMLVGWAWWGATRPSGPQPKNLGSKLWPLAVGLGVVSACAALWLGAIAAWTPAGVDLQWRYLLGFVGPFDHGSGRLAHACMLAWLAIGAWRGMGARATPDLTAAASTEATRGSAALAEFRSLLVVCIGLSTLAFVLTPRAIMGEESRVWGLGVRFLQIAEVLLLVVAGPVAAGRRAAGLWRRGLRWAPLGLVVVHAVPQWHFFAAFQAPASAAVTAVQRLPPDLRLASEKDGSAPCGRAWAPVLMHLDLYYLAAGGACASDVFAGGHLPIRRRQTCDSAEADFVYQQSRHATALAEGPRRVTQTGRTLLASSAHWRLWGRPQTTDQTSPGEAMHAP